MAKIVDPDDINVGTEMTLDTSLKTFTLVAAGNLVAKDGVTGNALWAKFVDLWTSATYQPFPFPMNIIDARSGQFIFGQDPQGAFNGWRPSNDFTRQVIRDAGWSEYSNVGVLLRQYVGMVALASGFPVGSQFYFQRASGGSAINFTFDDAPNEAIQVFGGPSDGNFDERTFFKKFLREEGYTYDDAVLSDVGETGTGAYKLQLPVSVASDAIVDGGNITDTDGNVATLSPYTQIKLRYLSAAYNREIDSATPRNVGILVDVGTYSNSNGVSATSTLFTSAAIYTSETLANFAGGTLIIHEGTDKGTHTISGTPVNNAGTLEITLTGALTASESALSFTMQRATPISATTREIYTKIQYQLRQSGDVNQGAGTAVTGKTADLLARFVGPTLQLGEFAATNPNGGGSGVMCEGFDPDDTNSFVFFDNAGTGRQFPFIAAGALGFNSFLTEGGTGYYKMYFSALPGAGDDYGEAGAVVVDDATAVDISGVITGASIPFTFDYDNNVQGGRTAATDALVTVIAGNPGSAKPTVSTGTLTRAKGLSIQLSAEQDRGYIP